MTRISQDFETLQDGLRTAVLVVGSGYGAAIAASRLARAGQQVTLIERGREIRPGDYPNTAGAIAAEMRVTMPAQGRRMGADAGLFDLHVNPGMNVLVGNGLGGTSLINANVSLEVDTRLFDAEGWPALFRDDPGYLTPFYARARKGLGANSYPDDAPQLPKLAALKQSAQAMGQPFRRPPINVTFQDGANAFGFAQNACTLCGDCCTGCNFGAKNTTLMNYLPDAHAFGATLFTGTTLRHLEKTAQGWIAHVVDSAGDTPKQIHAEMVLLGAGALGSTEALLRSRDKGLALSDRLGQRFSGNGDVLGWGYNANVTATLETGAEPPAVRAVGAGANPPDRPETQPGPCIAGLIDMRDPELSIREGMVIEEGVLPGPMATGFTAGFFLLDAIENTPLAYSDAPRRLTDARDVGTALLAGGDLSKLSYDGPLGRTMTYLVMSHDDAGGQMSLDHDMLAIHWPEAGDEPAIARDNQKLREACDAIWAEYVGNPIWGADMGRNLISVHPIGGCAMGDDVSKGVVDAWGRVFDPAGGFHTNLYVCDGAILPGALGVNPLLTISALSEHIMAQIAADQGWTIDYDSQHPSAPATLLAPPPKGMDVTTRLALLITALKSYVAQVDAGDFASAKSMFETAVSTLEDALGLGWAAKLGIEGMEALMGDGTLSTFAEIARGLLPTLEEVEADLKAGKPEAVIDAVARLGDISPGFTFDEVMCGHGTNKGLSRAQDVTDPHALAAALGAEEGQVGELTGSFHVDAGSVAEIALHTGTPAGLSGHVDCGHLGGRCSFGKGSTFRVLVEDQDRVETWRMIYEGPIHNAAGDRMFFRGIKTLHQRAGSTWWRDLTELSVDVFHGDKPGGNRALRGRMVLGFDAFLAAASRLKLTEDAGWSDALWEVLKQVISGASVDQVLKDRTTMGAVLRELLHLAADNGYPELRTLIDEVYLQRFAAKIAGLVFRSYGGVYAYMSNYPAQDDAARRTRVKANPPKRKLPIPKGMPQVHMFETKGKNPAQLRLARYHGGDKGPVVLAPGFGVSAASYHLETTEVTLTERLFHEGYDVWLFDYRASPALEAARQPFTIDDIALADWPAAIDTVRQLTGAPDVQVIAHCFGSVTVLMALLTGMEGVRSVISSQTSLHPVTSAVNYAKADSHLATLVADGVPKSLDGLIDRYVSDPEMRKALEQGLDTVSLVPAMDPKDPQYMFDQALDLMLWPAHFPMEERCTNPVCHRVFGFFGASWLHDQLNEDTHNALLEVFGTLSTKPFQQIAEMVRQGRAVDAQGRDSYLSRPQNIRVPVDFLAGARNQIFLPETTRRTLAWLKATHPQAPADRFTRKLFPDYGHMDMFVGRSADRDVFPYLLERLAARGRG